MTAQILAISGTTIKQDSFGRFCLNDLHKAAGGEKRHSPNYWLSIQQTKELIDEIKSTTDITVVEQNQPVSVINGGVNRGSYAIKELVYAYATWISAKFFLRVIRAYDAMVNPVPYGLKEKAYPDMVAKPHFITRNMERHLQHHVDILVRQSNLTKNRIWRDFCAYFLIDSWKNLPMQNYVAACRYFEIEPIYTPECNNNFVYIDLSRFESVQDENKALRDKVTIFTKQQSDMFRPQEAVESLKKLGYTVLSGVDDDKMVLISVDELEQLRAVKPFIGDTKQFIQYLDEATDQGYRFVKKSDLYDLGLKIIDMGI